MGNYTEIEVEFIERTLELIDQYNADLDKYPFEKQFNHTLLLNCMLGLIIMPKEKVVAYIPNERLTSDYKAQIGLIESDINPDISKRLANPIYKSLAYHEKMSHLLISGGSSYVKSKQEKPKVHPILEAPY